MEDDTTIAAAVAAMRPLAPKSSGHASAAAVNMEREHRMTVNWTIITACLALGMAAQRPQSTIPEQLAKAGTSLASGPTAPSGPAPTFQQIIARTDIAVRAILAPPTSHLSEDQREIYTEYPLRRVNVLYGSTLAITSVVTFWGGTVTINGLTYTTKHEALPLPEQGRECILLLQRRGDRYFVAGNYYGAFAINDGKVTPLTKKDGFAPEIAGMEPQEFAHIVSAMKAMRSDPASRAHDPGGPGTKEWQF